MSRTFVAAAVRAALAAFALLAGLGAAEARREVPTFDASKYSGGTIVISNSERALYLVQSWGGVVRYPVAVGKNGKRWVGQTQIVGKYVEPDWSPPSAVKRDHPNLPNLIAGGTKSNPMGPRAMKLGRGQYAIHGTNRPSSIGTYASYGCIRMRNEDIMDLFGRVSVGTQVTVIP